MSGPGRGASPPLNHLLAALPTEELAALWPSLDRVEHPVRHIIMPADAPVTHVYFPETAWVSMVATMADGKSAEIGMVGTEGMIGLPLLAWATNGVMKGVVQGAGALLRMAATDFRSALDQGAALPALLLRYSLVFQEQVTQTAACNGHHPLSQRMARWLLMAHGRAGTDTFPMTQDILASMLCVHRPGITITARMFQQAGFIRYSQGQLSITDRAGLEAAACGCYATIRRRLGTIMGVQAA